MGRKQVYTFLKRSLKPTLGKMLIAFALLLFVPMFQCKSLVLCESIDDEDCSFEIDYGLVSLFSMLESYPKCKQILLQVPIAIIIIYSVISILIEYKNTKWK